MNPTEDPADTVSRAPSAGTQSAASGSARGTGNWFKSNLVALGSAAVLTVYAAGYVKTRAAAQRFAQEDLARQRPAPSVIAVTPLATETVPPTDSRGTSPAALPVSAATKPTVALDSGNSVPGKALIASNPVKATPPPAASAPVAAPALRDSVLSTAQTKNASVVAEPTKTDSVATVKTQTADSAAQPEKPKWKDGVYKGFGTSRHGDIEAEVEIKGGRIVFAHISNCLTQYPCSVFDRVVPQVISRQSAEVDYVSGATQSVNAFYYAVVEALSKAK